MKTFTSKKNKHEKLHDFFQVSNTESNQLLTDGKSFEQMIQSCSLKNKQRRPVPISLQIDPPPNSGDFHAIHTKDTNHSNNDHHQATTRCTGVFSSAKKGANRFRGVV